MLKWQIARAVGELATVVCVRKARYSSDGVANNKGLLCTRCDARRVRDVKTSGRKRKIGEEQQGEDKKQERMYGTSGKVRANSGREKRR